MTPKLVAVTALVATLSGCAAVAEGIFDAAFDAAFDKSVSSSDRDRKHEHRDRASATTAWIQPAAPSEPRRPPVKAKVRD